jgi:hypothetical protein
LLCPASVIATASGCCCFFDDALLKTFVLSLALKLLYGGGEGSERRTILFFPVKTF